MHADPTRAEAVVGSMLMILHSLELKSQVIIFGAAIVVAPLIRTLKKIEGYYREEVL